MKRILASLGLGLLAGAFGTFMLNLVTYLDMMLQGRQASSVPAQVAGRLAQRAHLEAIAEDNDSEEAQARRSASGALLGYATGLSMGLAYGILRVIFRNVPTPVAGVGLGIAAMASSDVPATMTKVTNPRQWSASNWISDIVPHLAFGLATVAAYEALTSDDADESRAA